MKDPASRRRCFVEAKTGETVLWCQRRYWYWSTHVKNRVCTTCHVVIREGFDSLEESDDLEDDMLDKA